MRIPYRFRDTLDEYRPSFLEKSAQSTRAAGFAQGMKSSDQLLQAWNETVVRKRDAPAILSTSGEIARTFGDIEQVTLELSQSLGAFTEGEILAVQIGNHDAWPSIVIACLRRGLVVLPLEQSVSQQQRDEALKLCKVSGTVFVGHGAGGLQISRLETSATPLNWGEHRPALLKLTSGTTATPRAVRFRSQQLLADCIQICESMGITCDDLNFGVIPISHSYGFSNLLTPLIACGVPMVVSRDRTPRAILADVARSEATVFPGMPVFYQAFCEMEQLPALSKLRLCISAGAPLPRAIAKKFQEKFNLPIHSFYGASECGGICYDREAMDADEGFVGGLMKGVNIEMIDSGASASQVRVRSAAVGDGYFPEPENEKLGAGMFVPDDLLSRTDSGFKIVGRVSDVINVAGKKVNPAEVEAHLLRFTGVRQAVVFGRPAGPGGLRNEEVSACVVTEPGIREIDLLQFCRTELSTWQVPKQIFIVDAIPANERGKISRRELSRHFSADRRPSSSP